MKIIKIHIICTDHVTNVENVALNNINYKHLLKVGVTTMAEQIISTSNNSSLLIKILPLGLTIITSILSPHLDGLSLIANRVILYIKDAYIKNNVFYLILLALVIILLLIALFIIISIIIKFVAYVGAKLLYILAYIYIIMILMSILWYIFKKSTIFYTKTSTLKLFVSSNKYIKVLIFPDFLMNKLMHFIYEFIFKTT